MPPRSLSPRPEWLQDTTSSGWTKKEKDEVLGGLLEYLEERWENRRDGEYKTHLDYVLGAVVSFLLNVSHS